MRPVQLGVRYLNAFQASAKKRVEALERGMGCVAPATPHRSTPTIIIIILAQTHFTEVALCVPTDGGGNIGHSKGHIVELLYLCGRKT